MTERKMAGLYVFLLLAWWGSWLALDAWRIEHLLTDADKWAGFRRDILWCAASAVLSVIFFMITAEKRLAVYVLLGCLALTVSISSAFVFGDAFIHWKFDMLLLSMTISWVGIVTVGMLPLTAFLMARS
ncbi:hypothetical protein JEM67_00230 (plasmid) [Serratia sp. PAMC26656]|uniref:hypothetical protein n=1 Tax=Serratia sp. PAMC26656 TaxID=2775909 RepID=UPI0018F6F92C|nr:hypothetical protein [Serratia sp. PAMC26656]MBJ7889526.1 hypothetical protein [Serratia sp. PAMC26656]